jgi:dipeptidyl aminopeptidase/acylaminoacyl peptidase
MVVENLPEIPAELADEILKYTESRGAGLADWHPTERSMLISTRFANTNQIHWVRQPGGARTQLTFFNEPVGGASFEPKAGEYFLFQRDQGGNEFGQIYRFDMSDGTVTLLTDGGRSQNGGVVWNHAKDQIVYASTRRNGADRDFWLLDPARPESGRMLCENSGGGWRIADWSPEDAALLAMEFISVNQSNLYLIDARNGQKTPLTAGEKPVSYQAAAFSGDGEGVYVTSDRGGEFQQLAYIDLATQSEQVLVGDLAWDIDEIAISDDGRRIAFVTNEAGVSKLYLFDTETRNYAPVENAPPGILGGLEWHANNRDLGFVANSARSPADIYSLDVESGEVVRWTHSELGGLIAENLNEPQLIEWSSFDGLPLSGFLYRPAARFTGPRPVIINIHGGPEGQSRPGFLGRNNYFLNELGVAILFPNVRGSVGFGKTFVTMDNALKREDSVRDIGALLDWIAQQPDLDAERVMVTGGSYGGYMTLAVATHYNDRIRCALDIVGISHFGTFLKNTESYRRDLRRVEYGDERDPEIAEFFDKISPLNNADKITKPLMIVQGGNDPRVPLSEAEQMVERVKANGSPVVYVMARDEGHGFRKKNNADFLFYATILFIKEHLLD